jgi:hypothetical protein
MSEKQKRTEKELFSKKSSNSSVFFTEELKKEKLEKLRELAKRIFPEAKPLREQIKDAIEENDIYLKNLNRCEHHKAFSRICEFQKLDDNYECAELVCSDCGEVIGLTLRSITEFGEVKINHITFTNKTKQNYHILND